MEAAAGLILAIAKAVPAFDRIYQRSVELYYSSQETSDQNQQNEVREEREAIASALAQPGLTDENRRSLRKRLISLSRL